jgi:hypothetical protein
MERRDLFKIITAGLVTSDAASAQHVGHAVSNFSVANYKPRYFSEADYKIVGRLCDVIVPADGHSPGAEDAGVAFYIDTTLHYARPEIQKLWKAGVSLVNTEAQERFGKSFLDCTRAQQDDLVALMASHEDNPSTPLERFFTPLKRMAVDGYLLSEAGARQFLGYRGNTALTEFRGCTHPEHQDQSGKIA